MRTGPILARATALVLMLVCAQQALAQEKANGRGEAASASCLKSESGIPQIGEL